MEGRCPEPTDPDRALVKSLVTQAGALVAAYLRLAVLNRYIDS
jgi:hypothetical protein